MLLVGVVGSVRLSDFFRFFGSVFVLATEPPRGVALDYCPCATFKAGSRRARVWTPESVGLLEGHTRNTVALEAHARACVRCVCLSVCGREGGEGAACVKLDMGLRMF